MSSLTTGINLSTYADECIDAAHGLDSRRRTHETKHRRFRRQVRPVTRREMEETINAVGVTELTFHVSAEHAPVKPVPGGVAFAPERMTVSTLEDVYRLVLGIKIAPEKVYDRVIEVIDANPTGMRVKDIMADAETARTSTQRALDQLQREGLVRVRLEKTRGDGSPRKRYFPVVDSTSVSLDGRLGVSI